MDKWECKRGTKSRTKRFDVRQLAQQSTIYLTI